MTNRHRSTYCLGLVIAAAFAWDFATIMEAMTIGDIFEVLAWAWMTVCVPGIFFAAGLFMIFVALRAMSFARVAGLAGGAVVGLVTGYPAVLNPGSSILALLLLPWMLFTMKIGEIVAGIIERKVGHC